MTPLSTGLEGGALRVDGSCRPRPVEGQGLSVSGNVLGCAGGGLSQDMACPEARGAPGPFILCGQVMEAPRSFGRGSGHTPTCFWGSIVTSLGPHIWVPRVYVGGSPRTRGECGGAEATEGLPRAVGQLAGTV